MTIFSSVNGNSCCYVPHVQIPITWESLQEFNFKFSKCIQAVSICKPKDDTESLKIYMHDKKLCNPAIGAKTFRNAHPNYKSHSLYAENLKGVSLCWGK